MHISPSGEALGARIEGIDLRRPLSATDIREVLKALGRFGVLCFPRQTLEVDAFAAFGRCFGGLARFRERSCGSRVRNNCAAMGGVHNYPDEPAGARIGAHYARHAFRTGAP